jgi:hypothetical protein
VVVQEVADYGDSLLNTGRSWRPITVLSKPSPKFQNGDSGISSKTALTAQKPMRTCL